MANQEALQSLATNFNTVSKSNLLSTKRCSELKVNKHYTVFNMKRIDTSVGESILVALGEGPYKPGDEPQFQMFLPKRFVQLLQDEDLSFIQPGDFYLVSHGATEKVSTELSLHVASPPPQTPQTA